MILGNYIFGKPVPQFFMYLLFDQVCPKSSKICSSSENPPIFGLSPPEFSSCLTKPTSIFTPPQPRPPHPLDELHPPPYDRLRPPLFQVLQTQSLLQQSPPTPH